MKRFDRSTLSADLRRLGGLEANWDGYQAPPMDTENIRTGERIIAVLPPFAGQPTIVPMTRGRFQFEWDRGGRSLEIEVESPDSIHWLKFDESGFEEEGVSSAGDNQAIYDLLNWFIS